MTKLEPHILFPDESKSFVHGVEYGKLLHKMEMGEEIITNSGFPVHKANKNLIINTCKKYNYIPIFGKDIYEEWIEFIGVKKVSSEN